MGSVWLQRFQQEEPRACGEGFLEVQSLVLQKGSQETIVQAGKDVLGRMNDRPKDRWGGIGDNDSHFRA